MSPAAGTGSTGRPTAGRGAGLEATFRATHDGFALELALAVPPGGTVAVVGPNGAGKSTLIDVLAGFKPVSSGRVVLGGRALDDPAAGTFLPPDRRPLAIVPQDGMLFPHLSVRANVAFGLKHRRPDLDRAQRDERADDALAALELAGLGDRRPSELSGGQAQRAAIARALVLEAQVLLLDEPLSNVDLDNRQLVRKLLRVNRPTEQIQIVVTHGRDHANDADHVLVLDGGREVAFGTPDELRADPPSSWVAELLG